MSYGILGSIHFDKGELDRAESLFRKALAITTALSEKSLMAIAYQSLGNTYKARDKRQDATGFYSKALSLCKETGDENRAKQVQANLEDLGN